MAAVNRFARQTANTPGVGQVNSHRLLHQHGRPVGQGGDDFEETLGRDRHVEGGSFGRGRLPQRRVDARDPPLGGHHVGPLAVNIEDARDRHVRLAISGHVAVIHDGADADDDDRQRSRRPRPQLFQVPFGGGNIHDAAGGCCGWQGKRGTRLGRIDRLGCAPVAVSSRSPIHFIRPYSPQRIILS